MSRGGSGTRAILTGDQEALVILLEPAQRAQLSEREETFILDLAQGVAAGRKQWTTRQQAWFNAIWQRVMGDGGAVR